jgi:hypothetical protein
MKWADYKRVQNFIQQTAEASPLRNFVCGHQMSQSQTANSAAFSDQLSNLSLRINDPQ